MKKASRGSTMFPNVLVEVFMPKLKDTEWRLLCVIVRQTIGWMATGGQRKAQDWLSHTQLKRRTGRGSAAVSAAIQGLLDRGLIAIRDADGNSVHAPNERMRHGKRLYFSLSSGLSSLIHTLTDFENRKAKATKQKHTKENLIDRKVSRVSGWTRAADVSSSD